MNWNYFSSFLKLCLRKFLKFLFHSPHSFNFSSASIQTIQLLNSRSNWSHEKNHENKMVDASISILKLERSQTRGGKSFFFCSCFHAKSIFRLLFIFILLISTIANWKILFHCIPQCCCCRSALWKRLIYFMYMKSVCFSLQYFSFCKNGDAKKIY